ncbi:hypothetical protein SCARR_04291 [Pontiella sulfatireligans]|uniref:Uncharacterized protein n=1 Tax=Pontiella sulfatireligans TaxID=2750658 RepID=A0A6C2UQ58_9BACT|nr:hypothetical protein SCARR_04291 [Pontiella sulfatireligans]
MKVPLQTLLVLGFRVQYRHSFLQEWPSLPLAFSVMGSGNSHYLHVVALLF